LLTVYKIKILKSSPPKEITYYFFCLAQRRWENNSPSCARWTLASAHMSASNFLFPDCQLFGEQRNDVTKLEAPSRVTQRNEGCSAQEVPCSLSGNYFRRWKFSQASYFPRRAATHAWH
jgi:hypothetical protein